MKVSELIAQLWELQAEHGDLEVWTDYCDSYVPALYAHPTEQNWIYRYDDLGLPKIILLEPDKDKL